MHTQTHTSLVDSVCDSQDLCQHWRTEGASRWSSRGSARKPPGQSRSRMWWIAACRSLHSETTQASKRSKMWSENIALARMKIMIKLWEALVGLSHPVATPRPTPADLSQHPLTRGRWAGILSLAFVRLKDGNSAREEKKQLRVTSACGFLTRSYWTWNFFSWMHGFFCL